MCTRQAGPSGAVRDTRGIVRLVSGPLSKSASEADTYAKGIEGRLPQLTALNAELNRLVPPAERELTDFIRVTGIDELIISMPVADIDARLKSIELFAGLDTIVRKAA